MSDSQAKSVEELNNEIVDLKIRITRLEQYILDTFNFSDPRDYINEPEESEFDDAVRLVVQFNTASASFLQRKMSIGYARAARLLNKMEEKELVGPAEGAKPREVLLDNITKYLKDPNIYSNTLPIKIPDTEGLYESALKLVTEYNTASASFLQRKMSIGYARAARLIDQLEENGIISPSNGDKPRKVFKTP